MGSTIELNKLKNIENNKLKEQSPTTLCSSKSPTSRPPRPTYTSKGKDGKYMVGVDPNILEKQKELLEKNNNMDISNSLDNLKEGSTNTNTCLDKETFKLD